MTTNINETKKIHNPKVSVIVPCYNAEKTLAKCLDSLLIQQIEIEVIVVNDGSTDSTLTILQQYQEKFDTSPHKLTIIDQANSGSQIARQKGIARAISGIHSNSQVFSMAEFLGFVDSDDWVDQRMFKNMYEAAINEQADIVSCGMINIDNKNNVLNINLFTNNYDKVRRFKIYPGFPPSLCISIFSYKLFQYSDIEYLPIMRGDDLSLVVRLFNYSKKSIMLDAAYYYYYNIIKSEYQNTESDNNSEQDMKSSKCPVNLQKDLKGINDLIIAGKSLAEFFANKECLAFDIIPLTYKFPEFFNRYNFKYAHYYFTKNNLDEMYFQELLFFIQKYPLYFLDMHNILKTEDKLVLFCFKKVFKSILPNSDIAIVPYESIFSLQKTTILTKKIKQFYMCMRVLLFFSIPYRIVSKVFHMIVKIINTNKN